MPTLYWGKYECQSDIDLTMSFRWELDGGDFSLQVQADVMKRKSFTRKRKIVGLSILLWDTPEFIIIYICEEQLYSRARHLSTLTGFSSWPKVLLVSNLFIILRICFTLNFISMISSWTLEKKKKAYWFSKMRLMHIGIQCTCEKLRLCSNFPSSLMR